MVRVLVFAVLSICTPALVFAHGNEPHGAADETKAGHSHAASEIHGGTVVMTPRYHFEIVYADQSMQIYAYDGAQKPIAIPAAKGLAKVSVRGGKTVTVPLRALPGADGVPVSALEGTFDFRGVKPGGAKVTFELTGLPDAAEASSTFRSTFGGVSKKPGHGDAHGHGSGTHTPASADPHQGHHH